MSKATPSAVAQYDRADDGRNVKYVHQGGGTVVKVVEVNRPTQMADPLTATDQHFWEAVARDRYSDEYEVIGERYYNRRQAIDAAREWCRTNPEGLPDG